MKTALSWLLAFVLSVLAAEFSLQILAAVLVTDGRDVLPGQTENYRVLALGDSNTFGLYLAQDETWPAQFEQLWNSSIEQSEQRKTIEVLNLGVPGTNSSRLLKNYPQLLETFKPNLVLIMIGYNDWWTPNEEVELQQDSGILFYLKLHSRLYKFFTLLSANSVEPEKIQVMERVDSLGALSKEQIIAKVQQDLSEQKNKENDPEKARLSTRVKYGDQEFLLGYDGAKGKPGGFKQLKSNLEKIKEISEKKQVELVLVSYASNVKFYNMANNKLALFSQELDLPLIDVRPKVTPICADAEQCPEYFFPDMHPRPKGYRLIAESVFEYFDQAVSQQSPLSQ